MRLFGNAHYKFLEARRTAYVGSAIALLLAIVFAIVWQVSKGSWLDYGVDFTGGTLVQVHFNQPATVGQLRATVEQAIPGSEITKFGAENEFLIRAPEFEAGGNGIRDRVKAALTQRFGENAYSISRIEAVGPFTS